MKVDRCTRLAFAGEDGSRLTVGYDNRGEPYREGISIEIEAGYERVAVFLTGGEVDDLRKLLNDLHTDKRGRR